MGEATTGERLALSWEVRGDDAPRLIIPLVRIEDSAGDAAGPLAEAGASPANGAAAASGSPAGAASLDGESGFGVHTRRSEVAAAWARLCAGSADLVITLDNVGRVLAMSPSAAELLAGHYSDRVVGRHLLDVLDLVDFHPMPGDASMYADRIPPLLAVASNTLARGLLRVRTGGRTVTLDAVAAPLHDASGALVGTICFLANLSG